MPDEIDFSSGERGKFHRPNVTLNLPVYLDADVRARLGAIAAKKGVSVSEIADDLLRNELADLDAVK